MTVRCPHRRSVATGRGGSSWALAAAALLASPAARADIGPDFGDLILAVVGWPLAVFLFVLVAAPGRRLAWALGVAAGYPLVFTVLTGFITRLDGTPFGGSRPALIGLWIGLVVLAVAMLWHRLTAVAPAEPRSASDPWAACAAALLGLLALACVLVPQFAYPIAPIGGSGVVGPTLAATLLVGAHLFAAWRLWRRRRWALRTAVIVTIAGMLLMLAAADGRVNGVLLAVWGFAAGAALIALGLYWRHLKRSGGAEVAPDYGPLDVACIVGILTLAPLGSPHISDSMLAGLRQSGMQREVAREQERREEAIEEEARKAWADMKPAADASAAELFVAMGGKPFPLRESSYLATGSSIPSDARPHCDLRLWAPGAEDGWSFPYLALLAGFTELSDDQWDVEISAAARLADGTSLRYVGEAPYTGERATWQSATSRRLSLAQDGKSANGAHAGRRYETFRLLGAQDRWGQPARNHGSRWRELPEWTSLAGHEFVLHKVWSEPEAAANLAASITLELALEADLAPPPDPRWRGSILLRSDDSVRVYPDGYDGVEARLADTTQAAEVRAMFGLGRHGDSGINEARLQLLAPRRLVARKANPQPGIALEKLRLLREGVSILLRVDAGEIVERSGRLERDVRVGSSDIRQLRAGLRCDRGVPSWFVDSFRLATAEGLPFPGPTP